MGLVPSRDAVRAAVTWAWLLVAPALVAATLASGVSMVLPNVYAAQAEIVFNARDPSAPVPEQARATQTVIVTGHNILQPVAAAAGLSVTKLEKALTAEFPRDGAVLRLQYGDRDGLAAQRILEGVVREYLAVLEGLKSPESVGFRLLTPPHILDQPISPRPLLAAAIGAAVGLFLAIAAMAAMLSLRPASS